MAIAFKDQCAFPVSAGNPGWGSELWAGAFRKDPKYLYTYFTVGFLYKEFVVIMIWASIPHIKVLRIVWDSAHEIPDSRREAW